MEKPDKGLEGGLQPMDMPPECEGIYIRMRRVLVLLWELMLWYVSLGV